MEYLYSKRYSHLEKLIAAYLRNEQPTKYLRLLKSFPLSACHFSVNNVELLYAVSNTVDLVPPLAIGEVLEVLLTVLARVVLRQVQLPQSEHLSYYFSLTQHLVEAVLKIGNGQETVVDSLRQLSEAVGGAATLEDYYMLFGFVVAVSNQPRYVVELLAVYQALAGIVDSPGFLSQLESMLSQWLELGENEGYLYDLYLFRSNFGEFCSLLFVKYLNLVRLNMVLLISHIRLGEGKSTVIETLIAHRAAELSLRELAAVDSGDDESGTYASGSSYTTSFSGDERQLLLQISSGSLGVLESITNGGAAYIILTSSDRLDLLYQCKSVLLEVFAVLYFVKLVNLEFVQHNLLAAGLVADGPGELASPRVGFNILGLLALLAVENAGGYDLNGLFTGLIAHSPGLEFGRAMEVSANCIALAYRCLDQENIIGLIYSLNNVEVADGTVFENSIRAIVELATRYDQEEITLLATSIIFQKLAGRSSSKLGPSVLGLVVRNLDRLVVAMHGDAKNFRLLLKTLLTMLELDGSTQGHVFDCYARIADCLKAHFYLVETLAGTVGLPLFYDTSVGYRQYYDAAHMLVYNLNLAVNANENYRIFLLELLNAIISKGGDTTEDSHHRSHGEISAVAADIELYFRPLSRLLPSPFERQAAVVFEAGDLVKAFRDVWFNMAIHGMNIGVVSSYIAKTLDVPKKTTYTPSAAYLHQLKILAYNTPPLTGRLASSNENLLELNTVLRRGSSNSNIKFQKSVIDSIDNVSSSFILPQSSTSTLATNPKLMFLSATIFLELLKTDVGDAAGLLHYFSDASVAKEMKSIATDLFQRYLANLAQARAAAARVSVARPAQVAVLDRFAAQHVAAQFAQILLLTCDSLLQNIAITFCDLLLGAVPSLLLDNNNVFRLLDLVNVLSLGIADYELHKYTPKLYYQLGAEELVLPDSLQWRQATFATLKAKAGAWIAGCYTQVTRSLLQEYIVDRRNSYGVRFAKSVQEAVDQDAAEYLPILGAGAVSAGELARVILADEPATVVSSIGRFLLDNPLENAGSLVAMLVAIPFRTFSPDVLAQAVPSWLVLSTKQHRFALVSEILQNFVATMHQEKGIFHPAAQQHPEYQPMEYAPSNKIETEHNCHAVHQSFKFHATLIRLLASLFQSGRFQGHNFVQLFADFAVVVLQNFHRIQAHVFSRLLRFEFLALALQIHDMAPTPLLLDLILHAGLDWFTYRKTLPVGDNVTKIAADMHQLQLTLAKLAPLQSQFKARLLAIFLADEIYSTGVWLGHPCTAPDHAAVTSDVLEQAYSINADLAINLVARLDAAGASTEKHAATLSRIVAQNPLPSIHSPDAISFILNDSNSFYSYYLLLWDAVSPIGSINLFFYDNPFVLQYAMKSLNAHDVHVTFFYVPQIVQMLRFDGEHYIERFIMDTAQISQLFAHQIIWNMLANSYNDDEGTVENDLKPTLDGIRDKMTKAFSPQDLQYYTKEFSFFKEITGISGKLKPYIKKTKAEKKLKIDEEMLKIQLERGVYLPSNPDGVLVDINRTSGKPLQSHAKAPFMATFKIKKTVKVYEQDDVHEQSIETWQSAIFKVGDDCRQDVLALQLISVFRSIWASNNLDLYVFPYRVTATEAGRGIIDVLPGSVSRDMLGREAVNGLYQYYITKFGPEYYPEFQTARNNLIKSLAAYSIISFLLQFKDRHNGNIMYDSQGHILHIDFGFCFDIVPGGVKFEAVPFKLTKEMIMVMGGSNNTLYFKRFEELCVQGFLACRPYMDTIVKCVLPMLESGLPCFKGQTTIKNLRARFVPHKSEKDAGLFMRKLIRKSYESYFTKGYDEFQRLTNGIPY